MFRNLVVALDGSDCALHAFELALSLAKTEGAKLTVCSVVDPKSAMWRTTVGPSAELAVTQARDAVDRLVREAIAKAAAAGVEAGERVLCGDPAAEIVAYAVREHADAIVMGTHGWTGIKHVVMGSVAETVLRSAPCPVVVVRADARFQIET